MVIGFERNSEKVAQAERCTAIVLISRLMSFPSRRGGPIYIMPRIF